MNTTTVLEIIKMIDKQQEDITKMFDGTRPRELRDCSWIFKSDDVKYGAIKSLHDLACHLQSFIENEVNKIEI